MLGVHGSIFINNCIRRGPIEKVLFCSIIPLVVSYHFLRNLIMDSESEYGNPSRIKCERNVVFDDDDTCVENEDDLHRLRNLASREKIYYDYLG